MLNNQKKTIETVSGRSIETGDLDSLIRHTMDSLQFPGLSIAVINDAEVVYHNFFGVKNSLSNTPVNDSTLFEGASLSKPLFAYFVMKLAEQHVIHLDSPLYKYLPHPSIKDNDERYKLITARMVLSHTTGFPNWSVDKPIEMAFMPGTGFSYSGEAHQYLTALLAVQMKTNWQSGLDSIFQKVVALPLGMKHSYFVRNTFTRNNKATGYRKDGSPKENWQIGSISFGGAHTLHSEAYDFAQFLMAMIKEEGLLKTSFDDMLREQIHFSNDSELLKYGQTGWCLGFCMKPTKNGMRYMHTGNNTGFQAFCCFYREKKYGLVFFTNSEKAFEFYDVISAFLDDPF